MAYDEILASRVRKYLKRKKDLEIVEKKMFGGLAFMIDDKMCINIGDSQLMCRFDPNILEELKEKPGFQPMIMGGRNYKGYCYVNPIGYSSESDFEFWVDICLDFNKTANSSRQK